MKKIITTLLIIFGISLNADNYILSIDNVQKVKELVCINGFYYVVLESSNEKIQLYKIQNNNEVKVTCISKSNVTKDKNENNTKRY